MNKGHEITRGKTKVIYESPGQLDAVVMQSLDNISAGDGARRDVIDGKGRLSARTTARVFRLLNLCGFPTHYLSGGEDDDDNEIMARRAQMIPLEVVVRGVAAGSFVKRKPTVQRGSLLVPRVVEFFFKDDANHDPLIEAGDIVARGIAHPVEIAAMTEIARMAYDVLAHAWRRRDTLLVDLKLEFGRLAGGENQGSLVIADVIDNDSWRIWPQGREDLQLDKQMYRDLQSVTPSDLMNVSNAYERVAEIVGTFPQMRPGMVAIIADGPEFVEAANAIGAAVQAYGLPSGRHVASSARTPGYVLQLLQQLESTFARLVIVAVSAPGSGLGAMLDAATTNPVIAVDPNVRPDSIAAAAAKSLALDDTVLYGRVLLTQANARSAVLQADAQLNAPPAPPPPGSVFA